MNLVRRVIRFHSHWQWTCVVKISSDNMTRRAFIVNVVRSNCPVTSFSKCWSQRRQKLSQNLPFRLSNQTSPSQKLLEIISFIECNTDYFVGPLTTVTVALQFLTQKSEMEPNKTRSNWLRPLEPITRVACCFSAKWHNDSPTADAPPLNGSGWMVQCLFY